MKRRPNMPGVTAALFALALAAGPREAGAQTSAARAIEIPSVLTALPLAVPAGTFSSSLPPLPGPAPIPSLEPLPLLSPVLTAPRRDRAAFRAVSLRVGPALQAIPAAVSRGQTATTAAQAGRDIETAVTGNLFVPGAVTDAPAGPSLGLVQTRVAVLYASFGAGHEMAAKAVQKACQERGLRAETIDILDYLAPWKARPLRRTYLFLFSKHPGTLNALYRFSDRAARWPGISRLWHALGRLNYGRLVRDLAASRPDVLVSTYLPLQAIDRARGKGLLRCAYGVVLTDWRSHSLWLDARPDRYYVAGEMDAAGSPIPDNRQKMVGELLERGVPADKIAVTGIPVDPDIQRFKPRRSGPERPTALVMMGGYGVGDLEAIVESFRGERVRLEIVAGRNESVRRRLEHLAHQAGLDARVHGFVPHDLLLGMMADASLIVTKPGGISVSEAASLGKPMLLIGPVLEIERDNARMVVGKGAGALVDRPSLIGGRAVELLYDPARLAKMSRAARRLGNPRAAGWIVEDLSRFARPR